MGPNLYDFVRSIRTWGEFIGLKRKCHAIRKIGASKELSRKEREADERENDVGGAGDDDDEMDM